ncbi:MAG: DUF302 domain-containing protein [Rhizobiaceae bacterium]|nr:DUF302 domain-containing protein [Rhizobiaceae bacterium]MBL4695584.1 DUF302 domain-containing protein [Rhizobiaceae bacterium]
MDYTINRVFSGATFDEIVGRTREALTGQGFGVLTEIDVKQTLKKKIDADINDYLILGACSPKMAHEAIKIEPRIGAMLPCNVIIRSLDDGQVEVSAIDPQASMQAVENDKLQDVAGEVKSMMQTVVTNI